MSNFQRHIAVFEMYTLIKLDIRNVVVFKNLGLNQYWVRDSNPSLSDRELSCSLRTTVSEFLSICLWQLPCDTFFRCYFLMILNFVTSSDNIEFLEKLNDYLKNTKFPFIPLWKFVFYQTLLLRIFHSFLYFKFGTTKKTHIFVFRKKNCHENVEIF